MYKLEDVHLYGGTNGISFFFFFLFLFLNEFTSKQNLKELKRKTQGLAEADSDFYIVQNRWLSWRL